MRIGIGLVVLFKIWDLVILSWLNYRVLNYHGLKMAWEISFRQVILQSESKVFVDSLTNGTSNHDFKLRIASRDMAIILLL